jgi:hypothetical protein
MSIFIGLPVRDLQLPLRNLTLNCARPLQIHDFRHQRQPIPRSGPA